MWTWEQERRHRAEEPPAQLGMVTLGGAETAANLGGERRWLGVCTPGGLQWKPRQGEQVLVLKSGQEAWVLGVMHEEEEIEPGQVRLRGENCSVLLANAVEIQGEVKLNGQPLKDYICKIVAETLTGD